MVWGGFKTGNTKTGGAPPGAPKNQGFYKNFFFPKSFLFIGKGGRAHKEKGGIFNCPGPKKTIFFSRGNSRPFFLLLSGGGTVQKKLER